MFQLFFFFLFQRILGSKTYTEQQGTKGSQFDDIGGRLFFLRSLPDESLKDQKAFTPFAWTDLKTRHNHLLSLKSLKPLFQCCFASHSPLNWAEMLVRCLAFSMSEIQSFRDCKTASVVLIAFNFEMARFKPHHMLLMSPQKAAPLCSEIFNFGQIHHWQIRKVGTK